MGLRGYPRFNFDAFDEAAAELRGRGHTVYSPADHDREMGFDPDGPEPTREQMNQMLEWDLVHVCRADAIWLLPGWQYSEGATLEHRTAVMLDKQIQYPIHTNGLPTSHGGDKHGEEATG